MQTVGIIGAGAWGTALATAARRAGRKVIIYARKPDIVTAINTLHTNPDYLPGIPLDPAIHARGDYAAAASADLVLLATPAQFVRAATNAIAPHLANGTPVVICAKGIEQASGKLLRLLPKPRRKLQPRFCPARISREKWRAACRRR